MPDAQIVSLGGRPHTFCIERFDRNPGGRRVFTSAMTLVEHRDGESGSYVELAVLFRRVVFNVLVSNRDDHLRNHGSLRTSISASTH